MTNIYSITTEAERNCLAGLANEVPDNGLVVEIGTLYGGTTAVLASQNKNIGVMTIDDYSWHPENMPETSAILTQENLAKWNIDNVTVVQGDSRVIGKTWSRKIDLLFIDGGHSYQYVYSDLHRFGQWAKVIALHDYKNPQWSTIEKAIDVFLGKNPDFYISGVVDMICVLRRK